MALTLLVLIVVSPTFLDASSQHSSAKGEVSILGMMLQGHIFKNITKAAFGDVCLRECYQDIRCQSFNYVFTEDICELSNRTKEARPEDFVPNFERYYFRKDMKRVPLGSVPELAAETCKEIKTSEGGQAVSARYWIYSIIPEKIVFAYCDMKTEDVDECSSSIPICDPKANCQNTEGSFHCQCVTGFSGDGRSCTDADECSSSIPVCDPNANCQNTEGSFRCQCMPGFSGDRKSCTVSGQSFVTVKSSCASLLTIETRTAGLIYSNYNGTYLDHMNCNWTISSNAKLELAFIRFQTESGYDFVKVYDGPTSSSTLIGEYDGDSLPRNITSSSHELFITFTTDGSVIKPGFLAHYHISGQPFATVSSSCADKLTVRSSSSGIIFSNRDGAYAHDVNCSWSIFSSTNVELVFFRFDTEENHDYIYVYDGGSMMSSLIGKYHGNSLPAVITSSSNQLYVTFSSDNKVSSTGFAASYHAYNTIRLVGGNTTLTGRVEVYHGGQWGTICEDGWDINDAHVICRQLGFPSATQAFHGAKHGQGSGQIWIDSLDCSGYELRIDECNHDGWGNHDCGHSEDASVECSSTIP